MQRPSWMAACCCVILATLPPSVAAAQCVMSDKEVIEPVDLYVKLGGVVLSVANTPAQRFLL
jgi:hypothetical protein